MPGFVYIFKCFFLGVLAKQYDKKRRGILIENREEFFSFFIHDMIA